MLDRILLAALAVAIFLGAGGYSLASLNQKSLILAEVSRDACYARYGINPLSAPPIPEAIGSECTRPMRDYRSDWIWRDVFAAAVGATAAFLVVGGIVIVRRRRAHSGVQAIDR